jgi:hypothetical protein
MSRLVTIDLDDEETLRAFHRCWYHSPDADVDDASLDVVRRAFEAFLRTEVAVDQGARDKVLVVGLADRSLTADMVEQMKDRLESVTGHRTVIIAGCSSLAAIGGDS